MTKNQKLVDEQFRQDIEAMREKLASMEDTLNKVDAATHFNYLLNKVDKAFPQKGDTYFYICSNGLIDSDFYNGNSIDKDRIAMGNFYQTRAEAEKARDKQLARVRVIRKLRELDGDWVTDWKDKTQLKHFISYRRDIGRFSKHTSYTFQYIDNELYSTEEAQQWVMNNMADDVKLMMGVE